MSFWDEVFSTARRTVDKVETAVDNVVNGESLAQRVKELELEVGYLTQRNEELKEALNKEIEESNKTYNNAYELTYQLSDAHAALGFLLDGEMVKDFPVKTAVASFLSQYNVNVEFGDTHGRVYLTKVSDA